MEQNKKNYAQNIPYIVIIAMAIALVIAFVKIESLESEIDNVRSNYVNEMTMMQSSIGSIYSNVDEQLKQQASILSAVDYEYGELDAESKTATISLTVVPKVLTEDMQVQVTVGDRTVQLTRNESRFKADVPVDLFVEYDNHPLLTIETAGEIKTEYLDRVDVSYLFGRYLPRLYSTYTGQVALTRGKLIYDGRLSIESKPEPNESIAKFVSYEIVAELNGVEVSREDITADIGTDGFYQQDYHAEFVAGMDDDLKIYIVAVDSLGFIHKDVADHWHESSSGAVAETVYGGEYIYDPHGDLLYGEL